MHAWLALPACLVPPRRPLAKPRFATAGIWTSAPAGARRHSTGGDLPDTSDTSDNIVQDRHLGDFLRVDLLENGSPPLRALIRLEPQSW